MEIDRFIIPADQHNSLQNNGGSVENRDLNFEVSRLMADSHCSLSWGPIGDAMDSHVYKKVSGALPETPC